MESTPVKRLQEDMLVSWLEQLVGICPHSEEPRAQDPARRSRELTASARTKAAAWAGGLALPVGPWSLLTILPDLKIILTIQSQLIADIAAAHGRSAELATETMVWCLFRHTASQFLRDQLVRHGQKVAAKTLSRQAVKKILRRAGISLSERVAAKAVSRWIPVVGALGVAGFAWYDTSRIGEWASGFFGQPENCAERGGATLVPMTVM